MVQSSSTHLSTQNVTHQENITVVSNIVFPPETGLVDNTAIQIPIESLSHVISSTELDIIMITLIPPFAQLVRTAVTKSITKDKLVGTALVAAYVTTIHEEYIHIISSSQIFAQIRDSIPTIAEPLNRSYAPKANAVIKFWKTKKFSPKVNSSIPISSTPPSFRYQVDPAKRYSVFSFNLVDVRGDGNCYYRCLSSVLFGDEKEFWYFKTLLRVTLVKMNKATVLAFYHEYIGALPIHQHIMDDVLQTHMLTFGFSEINDDNIWMLHKIFCDIISNYDRYTSSIHYYLFYIFFGINTRIWGPSSIDIRPILHQCELKSIIPKEDIPVALDVMPIVSELRSTIKSHVIDITNAKPSYIQVCLDPCTHCPLQLLQRYRDPDFNRSNIGIDFIFIEQNHFNVIHWNEAAILTLPSLSSTDVITSIVKNPYVIETRKGAQHAFKFPLESMSDILIDAREAPTVKSLDALLKSHIYHLWDVAILVTSSYGADRECVMVNLDNDISKAETPRKNKWY
jgi:hypothetical protein